MKFDENLAAIHGYLCADGYVIRNPENQNHKYYVIGFRNQNGILLKDFRERFERVFNKKPIIRKDGRCVVNSKNIYLYLAGKWSFYSNEWELPYIFGQNLKSWLKAFFDCEAWVEAEGRKNRRVAMDSINKIGIFQVQEALKLFGIKSQVKINRNRDTFRLQIFGKQNIEKFAKNINFLHPDKNGKLKDLLNSYPVYEWSFPKKQDELKIFIKKIIKERARLQSSEGRPIYVCLFSIIETNLQKLSKGLEDIYGIKSKVYRSVNGNGTVYHRLNIQDKNSVKKMLENDLLSEYVKGSLALQYSCRS